MTPERFEEIVQAVDKSFDDASAEDRATFIHMEKDDLIQYHHGMGQWIRNHFKLWEEKWEPEVRDGTDYSPNHPDAISMSIIEEVWERRRKNVVTVLKDY